MFFSLIEINSTAHVIILPKGLFVNPDVLKTTIITTLTKFVVLLQQDGVGCNA